MAINISAAKKVSKQKAKNSEGSIFDFLNKDIKLFSKVLNDKKKEAFYNELSILLSAGVDIKTTLELISEEQVKEKDKKLYDDIKNLIVKGNTLSEAIKITNEFTLYEFYSIQIGEESGKITEVLSELGVYFQKKIKQRRQIIGALTYPSIVLCTSIGAIFFMMNFVVPMFADVFKRFGGDLPFITALILRISKAMSKYFYLIFIFIGGIAFFVSTNRKKVWFRALSSKIILKIPFVGEMIRKIYLARLCHSMTLLISAKIPILRAITLVRQMIGFYPIETSLEEIEARIMKGATLHESLKAYPIYHKRMISLIKVGEEVNQLENFFQKISKQYNDEVEHQTTLISSMIEPFMIIFLGLVVGIILIAMYLPLFQLSSTF
ncbi:MAG TPA: type II secretion system F family protein [Cytophagaceae bacterium]|jgi:type IV pilus assembly protein PilC